ncbi:hypothetical protein J2046_006236 [Rhizobium petrolearium]|uniref:hypothetical protein n=1 Tax=Neorhizobium petrolearium TaxID=515361 RepID=UPI001AE603CA|nr:hypothetical protein [Neorhizobium petrolearium]MBP1847951.1 hypothetical protein [Neorhizobium petrolearium]
MKAKQLALLAGMSAMLVGLGVLPGPAVAQVVQFDFGDGDVRIVRPDDDRRYYRRDEWRDDRRYERRYGEYGRPGCSPRQALAAASRYLDDPRIRSVHRRYYDIDGYGKRGSNRGRPDGVRISTAPNCERSRH